MHTLRCAVLNPCPSSESFCNMYCKKQSCRRPLNMKKQKKKIKNSTLNYGSTQVQQFDVMSATTACCAASSSVFIYGLQDALHHPLYGRVQMLCLLTVKIKCGIFGLLIYWSDKCCTSLNLIVCQSLDILVHFLPTSPSDPTTTALCV